MLQAIQILNERAGAQGVGRLDLVEDRLVGIKSREVYEAPGAIALITAHMELENVTVERELARFKRAIDQRWGELVYDGQWYSPLKRALDSFIDEAQQAVSGDIRMILHAGKATVTGRRSDTSLYDFSLATYDEGDRFDQSPGPRIHSALRHVEHAGGAPGRQPVLITPPNPAAEDHQGRLWGGRFEASPAEAMATLSRSTHFDWRLAPYDVAGSRAHARALHQAGLLTDDELPAMIDGLDAAGG